MSSPLAKDVSLSPKQAQWVRENPVIRVGLYSDDTPPLEIFRNGKPDGFSYDYLVAIATNLGLRVEARKYNSLAEELDAACRGEIDVIMNLMITAERTKCLAFTQAYIQTPAALTARIDDERPTANAHLTGLRVAVERDFYTNEGVRERYPNAIPLEAKNTLDALRMVSRGRADVYLGNPYLINALLRKHDIHGLGLIQQNEIPLAKLHYGVPNSKEPLAGAIDAAMAAMPDAQSQAIKQRWLPVLPWTAGEQPSLTPSEAAALEHTLKLGFVTNFPPLSFTDPKGEPTGLAAEYLRRFRDAGAKFELVKAKDLGDIKDKLRKGEIDAVIGMPLGTPTPSDSWIFSKPFLTVADVIVTREGSYSVRDIHDLGEGRIALSDPDRLGPLVLAQAPSARFVLAHNVYEGLSLVSSGQADAYIGNLAVVDRLVQEHYTGSLHLAAPASINDEFTFAARPQYASAVAVFDRMRSMMSQRERASLRGAWMGVEYRSGIDWRVALRWLLPICLALLAAALVAAIGYRHLRREVEERRRVEKRLAKVTDNLPAVVYQLRRTPDGTFSFPFIAGDVPSMFGATADAAMRDERYLFSLVHPDDQVLLEQALEIASISLDNLAIDFRVKSSEGWRWIRSRGRLHQSDRGMLLWSGFWIDVTEARAQSEALVAAKAEAERAAAAKAEFLATMSHEIRTPMSGVLGMLEVLAHTGLDGEQQRVVKTMEDSAQMLRQIIDDILDFSKIEAGALTLEATPIHMRDVIDNVQQMLSAQAADKQLRITNTIDARVAATHLADGIRLRQILFNLLSNAIKFTEHGGVTILLTVLDENDADQSLRLSVIDTGVGISDEQKERLFRPFSQAEISTQRQYGGTGLGLSICQRLVDLMGGDIQLNSAPHQGTRVDVTLNLPVCIAGAAADHSASNDRVLGDSRTAKVDWSGLRVLVAEDHPTNQTLMKWRMSQLNVACDVVADGATALEALRTTPYDLVITDCHMPVMDGYGFARERRREEATASMPRLPIIALTASAVSGESELCRESGMDDFLVKPVNLVELQEAMARWLPSKEARQSAVAHKVDDADTVSGTAWQSLLQRFGSIALVEEIVDSLVPAMHDDIAGLRKAATSDEASAVHERLHRIAGAVDSIGEEDLAEHAKDLMHAIERDGMTEYAEAIDDFLRAADGYVRQLEAPDTSVAPSNA
ncbi:two-component system, NarL family, sensor histidine kinase EvgS [Dyella sp. OK004]|uniref:ATP-binding protein n=1 Tax=Dyella sp. OK004 TaxID=1855292 RepID=UPI0008E4C7DA|nr:transporter substrate-binding domain-containing protein [Dyella sp. OK004]SFR95219.1 two-component system, NarL family, sensor histidine kinase EvgS [Dyella sp. OK004]